MRRRESERERERESERGKLDFVFIKKKLKGPVWVQLAWISVNFNWHARS